MERVKDLDLYKLLEVAFDADEATIRKAYRKKALKCHPDKNPDDAKAAIIFHQLSDALSVLSDVDARKAYDNVLKARQAAQIRNQQLDAKRQKLKQDLEERERAAKESVLINRHRSDEEILEREIIRLQKEGRRQLEEEQERMRQLIEEERLKAASAAFGDATSVHKAGPTKIKVRWSSGSYDSEMLRRIFAKFGDVLEVVVLPSSKKKSGGSGLVEMATKQAAVDAVNIEQGFADNPLKLKLLDTEGKGASTTSTEAKQQHPASSFVTVDNFSDFETLVMRQMRQQEERKRLIAEMMKNDEEEETPMPNKR